MKMCFYYFKPKYEIKSVNNTVSIYKLQSQVSHTNRQNPIARDFFH